MSDIPEDVMESARETWGHAAVLSVFEQQAEVVARAIMAERKRIANLARAMRSELNDVRAFDKGKIAALGYIIQACGGEGMVGDFTADYSELSSEQLAQEPAGVSDLLRRSRVVASKRGL